MKKLVGKTPSVILINPKFPHNVGTALRSCSCWGIEQLWWTGDRVRVDVTKGERLPREERMKGYKHVDFIHNDRPFDHMPVGAVPVAVELREGAELLPGFEHPDNAVYVFGPEDGGLTQSIARHCHRFVVIPTHHCLNLSTAVNVVLYDRRFKRQLAGKEPILPMTEMLKEQRGAYQEIPDDSWAVTMRK